MTPHPSILALDEVINTTPAKSTKPVLEFKRPSELVAYRPPPGSILVGEHHIVRGAPSVIGGAPGVGKSRASVALAVAGATGQPWFGLRVHRRFKTLILQNENGLLRLRDEFAELPLGEIEDKIRVSPPPPLGFAFDAKTFTDALEEQVQAFQPDVVILDPWNAATRDDKAADYLDAFRALRSLITKGDDGPALVIVAHTRKPKSEERNNGRGLLNLLSGSYVLGSVPRSVFIIQPASEEPEDCRVVFTCCKNNDGQMGSPSAWERGNGLFAPVENFDWDEFRSGSSDSTRKTLSEANVAAVFRGNAQIPKKQAIALLKEQTGCKQSTAYLALSKNGRFADHIGETESGLLHWIP